MNFEKMIIDVLKKHRELSGYKLISSKNKSRELFLIKDKIDINRGKEVSGYNVTVYVDFEENGTKYRSSAQLTLAPTLSQAELEQKISEGAFSAKFVKTKWYPLSKPEKTDLIVPKFDIDENKLGEQTEKIAEAILAEKSPHAIMNSAEVFLTTSDIHFQNSEGVDVCYKTASNKIEVITSCKADPDDVEVYGDASYANLSTTEIRELVKSQLQETEERSTAKRAKRIPSINVILRNSAVPNFFDFFVSQTSGAEVFAKASRAEIGKNFQGDSVVGDFLTITLKPFIENSASSAPFDADGIILHPVTVIEKGTVKQLHSNLKFAQYLNIAPTGMLPNVEVASGSRSYAEMQKEPYVEILRFSDFLCDTVTGDFGGEFRLAKYFDGEKLHVINNGAISANIFDIQRNMFFSKERMQHKSYLGPKAILLPNLEISGD